MASPGTVTKMRIWFASWNAANAKAKAAYEERLQQLETREFATVRRYERNRARERRELPEMCKPGEHLLAEVGVTWDKRNYWRCKACVRARHAAHRRSRGVPLQIRFDHRESRTIREQYETGGKLTELARQHQASVTAIRNAIVRAGGTVRSGTETRRLRRRLNREESAA